VISVKLNLGTSNQFNGMTLFVTPLASYTNTGTIPWPVDEAKAAASFSASSNGAMLEETLLFDLESLLGSAFGSALGAGSTLAFGSALALGSALAAPALAFAALLTFACGSSEFSPAFRFPIANGEKRSDPKLPLKSQTLESPQA